jgi:tetratricopeptide (TPR) repeat protein/nucleoside phosphorylase
MSSNQKLHGNREVPELRSASFDDFRDFGPDVVILTATKIERDTVLAYMLPPQQEKLIAKLSLGADTFYLGILGHHPIALVMCSMGAVGRGASALTVSNAIATWRPKAVIAVGLAFGMNPLKHRLGDVLISRTVSLYDQQRVQDGYTIFRGVTAEAGQYLLNRFLNVSGWRFETDKGALVEMVPGEVLSGEKLIDSANFKRQLLERFPEAIGGEMEGAGVYAAAEQAKVEWLIVKGICDWANGTKESSFQPFAAAAAVSLVEHVLSEPGILNELRRPKVSGDLSATKPALPPPRQLPAPRGDFVGRERALKTLLNALRPDASSAIAGISGLGGIGKTELAILAANRLRESYPDAQLFVRMSTVNQKPRDVRDVLTTCIRAFRGPSYDLADDLESLINEYRTCLTYKRALIVLDDVSDAMQVRPLLPPSNCALLLTSRNTLPIWAITRVLLDQLQPEEAHDLFISKNPDVDLSIVKEICALCGYLPLAVNVAATQLEVQRDLDPHEYLEKLRDERTRLEQLNTEGVAEVSVNASFNLSYENLSAESARTLKAISVFVQSFAAKAEETICEDPNRRRLSDLVQRNLVSFDTATKRYRLHDLFRVYTRNQLASSERSSVEARHANYYFAYFEQAGRQSLQGGDSIVSALTQFDSERTNIEAAFTWARQHAQQNAEAAEYCSRFPIVGGLILGLRLSPTQRISWLEPALESARSLPDRNVEVSLLIDLGCAMGRANKIEQAISILEEALGRSRLLGNKHEEGRALDELGWCYADKRELQQAIPFHEEALGISTAIGDLRLRCSALANLGWIHVETDEVERGIAFYDESLLIARQLEDSVEETRIARYSASAQLKRANVEEAVALYDTSLTLSRVLGSKRDEWSILDSLAYLYKDRGEARTAIEYYQMALTLALQNEDLAAQSSVLDNLATAHSSLGEYSEAIEYQSQNLSICREMADSDRENEALARLADAYSSKDDFDNALSCHLERANLNRRTNNRVEECRAVCDAGTAYLASEKFDAAIDSYNEGLRIAREIKSGVYEAAVLNKLGQIHFKIREFDRARQHFDESRVIFTALNEIEYEASVLKNLGVLYLTERNFPAAIEYFERLMTMAEENSKTLDSAHDAAGIALGVCWAELGDLEKGKDLLTDALGRLEKSNDAASMSFVLNGIGYCHFRSDEDLAIHYYERALDAARESGVKDEEVRAVLALGALYRQKNPKRAIEHLEESLAEVPNLAHWSELPESSRRLWEAGVLQLLGGAHVRVDDYSSAIACLERALVIYEGLNKQDQLGQLLCRLGACFSELKQHERAIKRLEEAATVYRETNNVISERDVVARLLKAHWELGDQPRLRQFCEKVLPVLDELEVESKYKLTALILLATSYKKTGALTEAADCMERALVLGHELESTAEPYLTEAGVLIEIGCSEVSLGDVPNAIELFNRALDLAILKLDKLAQYFAHSNLGWAYSQQDEVRQSITHYRKALDLSREMNAVMREYAALIDLGFAHRRIGLFTESIGFYQEVLKTAHMREDRTWEIKALMGIGNVHRESGRLSQAVEFHEQALTLARTFHDRAGEAFVLIALGLDCRERLEYSKAIQLHEEALSISNEVRNRLDELGAITTLGDSYRKNGETSRAIRLHEQGLIIAREITARFEECRLLGSLADDYFDANELMDGQNISTQELTLARTIGDQNREARSLFRLARIAEKCGNYRMALDQAMLALEIFERIEDADGNEVNKSISEWQRILGAPGQ